MIPNVQALGEQASLKPLMLAHVGIKEERV